MINKKNITKCGMTIVFLRRAFSSSSIWPGDELLVKTMMNGQGFNGYELYVNGGTLSEENGKYFIPEDDFLVVAGPKRASIYLKCLQKDVETHLGILHSTLEIPKKIIIFKKLKKPEPPTDEWNNNWKPPKTELDT